MRRAAVAFAIALILILGGLLVAPQFLDLNRLKAPIIEQVAAQTGYRLELDGRIGLRLLPSPTLTARGVRLANPQGATVADMVRLRAMDVKLAFWPLLAGNIVVRHAVLVEPEIDLERLPDGRINWLAGGNAGSGSASGDASPGGGRLDIAIERVDLQNGAITYRSQGTIERFEHIDARIAVGGPSGPFGAKGALVARGASLDFDARAARSGGDELSLQLDVTSRPAAKLRLEAVVSGDGDDRRLHGQLTFKADDVREVAATLARMPVPAFLAQPLSFTASIGGSMRKPALDNLTVDLGAAHGQGSLQVATGTPLRLHLMLGIDRVDVDHWPMGRRAMLMPALIGSAFAATPDATATIPTMTAAAAGLSLPRDIDASLDLGVRAVLWRNGIVRNAKLKASLAGGKLTVERLAALLPGGSDTTLSGAVTITGAGPRLDGKFQAAADDLRGFADWLGVAVKPIPADRLRRASLDGQFALTADRLDISELKGIVDSTRLDAAATVLLRERPGIGLRLSADRLNLDAYLPQAAANGAAAAAVPSGAGDGMFGAFDMNLDAHVDALTWRGQTLGNLHLAATLQNGDATIHELGIGDLGGAAGKLSGSIAGLAGAAPNGKLDLALQGPELERVARLLWPPLAGRFYGPFALEGRVDGNGDALALDAKLDVLEGHAHLRGTLAPAQAKIDLSVDADCPSTERVIRIASPNYRPAGGDPGPFKLAAHLSGEGDALTLDGLALGIGTGTLEGKLAVDLSGARPHLAADLKLGDWSIDRLLPARQTAELGERRHASLVPGAILAATAVPAANNAQDAGAAAPLDVAALSLADADVALAAHSIAYGAWQIGDASLAATLKDGTLSLGHLSGQMFGGTLQANGALASGGAKATLRGHATIADADLKELLSDALGTSALAGRLAADVDLATSGGTAQDLASHLAGSAALDAHDGTLAGIDLDALSKRLQAVDHPVDVAALIASGAGGATPFSKLDGHFRIDGGVAQSDDLQLVTAGGEGQGTARIDLAQGTMTSRIELRLAGIAQAPPLQWRGDGPIDAPHGVFDVDALQQFLDAQQASKPPPAPPAARPPAATPPAAEAPAATAPAPSDHDAKQRLQKLLKEILPE